MKSWVLAVSLLAATAATGTKAADLDDGPPPDRYGSAYDDSRYADIYRYPKGPPEYASPPPYAGPPRPVAPVYGHDDDDDYPPPRRYSYADRRPPYAGHCVPRHAIKERLVHRGWQDFHDVDLAGDVVTIHARRPNGRLFALSLDRCTGEVIGARPLEPREWGPYAYGRRWDRAY